MKLKIPPLALVVLVGLAMVLASRLVPGIDIGAMPGALLALLLAGAGCYFCVFGVLEFRRHQTTVDPRYPDKSSALVSSGVYALSRNPMYVGFALWLCALVAFLQSPWLLIGVLFFVWYIDRFQIRPEEAALSQHFGEQFSEYRARVRRWI
ncbi:membrane protein [Marinobacterium nitratireducens]|uniref:Membrane protein n=1 Tax=Marinobacterium nitratireducens TaxID=518897 RepID=A0A917ZCE7_9GAMM|nr:isoprenylcysteine carboxylmethyltransferase family protein [Marinobacterium nitratireducens]GGO80511.1 membrane protein [Marinobacterium nitratireducens]